MQLLGWCILRTFNAMVMRSNRMRPTIKTKTYDIYCKTIPLGVVNL